MSKDYLGRDIDTAAIRESFEDTVGHALAVSDEVLVNFIVGAGKTWTDLEDQDDPETAACNMLSKLEGEVAKVSISDPGISTLVAQIEHDSEFMTAINEDVEAVATNKVSAVHIYAQFKRLFKQDVMNSLPYPGTEAEHVEGTNYRPDKIKRMDQTGKPITVVWTNDFVSAMPQGKRWENILDDVSKENTTPGSVPSLKGKNADDLEAIKSDATTRRNALRSIVKRSLQLHHQIEAVSMMPLVGFRFIRGTKENGIAMPAKFGQGEIERGSSMVTRATKCIWLYDSEDPSQGRAFSVTQFLNFDPKLALAEGGKLSDLVNTGGRGAAETETDTSGDGSDMADDAAQATLSQFHNWFNNRDNQMLVLKKIANRKADADGNDWLDLVGSMYLLLKPVYEKNRAAYEEVIKKDAA